MRLKKTLLVFLISTASLTYGQIKIGDNPQNINQGSVLELESTSRALVITRVSTTQMNAITPLHGAMVYNTNTQCIHYYNGSQWLNLCDALANSVNISLLDNGDGTYTFSDANNNLTKINNLNESLVVEDGNLILTDTAGNAISVELQNLSAQTFTTNATAPREFPSILITTDTNGTNYNFEVGVIDGLSIQDGSIRQIDLAGASVGSVQLRDNSVTTIAIAENAVTTIKIANNSVTNTKLDKSNIPLSGFAPPNAEVNLGNFKIINLDEPALDQDAATKNYVDQAITAGTADGSETILNNGTNINITGTGTSGSPYVINNTFTEVDGSVTNELSDLAFDPGTSILTLTNPATPSNLIDLSSLSGTGTDDQNLTSATLTGTILQIDIEDGSPAIVDLGPLSVVDTDDQSLSLSGNVLNIDDGTGVDLTPILGGSGSTELADQITIVGDGTTGNEFGVADNSITPGKIESPNTPNQMLTTNGAGTVTWAPIASGSTELADGITIVGNGSTGNEFEVADGAINSTKITDGTIQTIDIGLNTVTTPIIVDANVTPIKIAPGTPGQFLTTNGGGAVAWDNAPPSGDNQIAAEVPFTPTGNTTSTELQAAIEELQTEIDGISGGGAANPTDELITSFTLSGTSLNIAEGANVLPPVDLDPFFATDAELAASIAASESLDNDTNATNELQSITSPDGTVTITPIGNNYELSVAGNTDNQNILGSDLNAETLTIGIENGTSEDVDLSTFALETELATAITASEALDLDKDDTNEIQVLSLTGNDLALSNGGGTVTLTATSDGVVSNMAASANGFNVTGANGGFNGSIDLDPIFATDAQLSSAITASEALDLDKDDTNEIQVLSLTGNDLALSNGGGTVTLTATSDGVVSNMAASANGFNVTGANGGFNGSIDLDPIFATDAQLSSAITASEALDLDKDDTNEIQVLSLTGNDLALSNGGGTVTLTATSDGVVSNMAASANGFNVTGANGGFNGSIDLDPIFATDAQLSSAITASEALDLDKDDTNEIQVLSLTGNDLALSNGGGTVTLTATSDGVVSNMAASANGFNVTGANGGFNGSIDLDPIFATDAQLSSAITASEALDLDKDDTNEIQVLTLTGNDLALSNGGGTVTLTATSDGVVSNMAASANGFNVTGANGGFNGSIDLDPIFATDAQLSSAITASEALDLDKDDTNELQAITSPDASVTVTPNGTGYDLTVSGATIPTGTTGAIFFSNGTGGLSDSPTNLFWDDANDRLGIGTDSPDRALHVIGETRSTSFGVSSGSAALPGYSFYTNDDFNTGMFRDGPDVLGFSTGGSEALRIDASQNVGIGLTGPLEKLHVDGNIRADGDFISNGTVLTVPDYVFQKYFLGNSILNENYNFQTLAQIEEFAKKYHHLPGIKSAVEVKKDGFWNLSKSNLQNLEKIEELFLHTIEQEKKIQDLKSENEALAKELKILKTDLEEIKALIKKQ